MAGTWERRGTVTVTRDSKIVTGVGTYWTDAKNGPQIGNAFYGPNGQAHEVALIKSATELWLADEYKGATESGVKYQIDTTRVDSVPGLASRVAAVIGYAQGQYDNLDKWTQGGVDEDVTLTSPNGESVTVPSLPKMGKGYTAIGNAVPAAERAEAAAVRAEEAAAATSADRADVAIKAGQVASSANAAAAAENTAVSAADTATQKAASAATHDASAKDAAVRAENAASAVVGAVLDGGECDLSSGIYPQPITVAGKKYSTIWYVVVAGSVSGINFDVGDLLRYTTAKTGYYFKVDAKDDVYSVNGEKGPVVITPEKIGAENTGVANQLLTQHEAKVGAHPVSGISGLAALIDTITPPLGSSEWDRSRANVRAGHVPSDGTLLKRTDFPDMWSSVSAGNVPVVPDADWLADPTKRGSFTVGDGATTFRIPDQNGKYSGSLPSNYIRGDGLNSAGVGGVIQGDIMRNLKGAISINIDGISGRWLGVDDGSGVLSPRNTAAPIKNLASVGSDATGKGGIDFDASRSVPTGMEFRPVSITGCWVVKVIKSSKLAGL